MLNIVKEICVDGRKEQHKAVVILALMVNFAIHGILKNGLVASLATLTKNSYVDAPKQLPKLQTTSTIFICSCNPRNTSSKPLGSPPSQAPKTGK